MSVLPEKVEGRLLIEWANACFSEDEVERARGFEIISNHPTSKDLRITFEIAKRLLSDPHVSIAKAALFGLGYGVGKDRWSWRPGDPNDKKAGHDAAKVAASFTPFETRRAIELVDEETWSGPDGLGERCLDVLACNAESDKVVTEISEEKDQSLTRRAFCLFVRFAGDLQELRNEIDALRDEGLGEVVDWLVANVIPAGDV